MNYYYLAASLPPVSMDEPPRMSSQEFLAQCSEHLSRQDMEAVEAVWSVELPHRHPALYAWDERDNEIRNAIARIRARHLQADASRYLRDHEDVDVSIEKTVADAFTAATPLDREKSIDALRWRVIDDLAGLNEFQGAAMVAYALKLKLAERWASMDTDRGNERADSMVRPLSQSENTNASNAETGAATPEDAPDAA